MSTVDYTDLFNYLVAPSKPIKVDTTFHGQMQQINCVLGNDKTTLISTITEFMVNSGTVPIMFNTDNPGTTSLFNKWKNNVNANLGMDIPTGLRSFTEQYFRERWKSSFIVIKLIWEYIDGIDIPTKMIVMDGASIWVEKKSQAINGCTYYLGNPKSKTKSKRLSNTKNVSYIIRKPFNQLYDTYPVPYLVRKGALYHALFKFKVLDRQSEIIETAFPYQLLLKVGTQEAIKRGQGPSQEDLDNIKEKFQNQKKEYDEHVYDKGLIGAFAGDVNIEELMPEYKKVTDEAILKPVDRNILNSLGMIELKGFGNREETVLNPKVLVEEVENGVKDYVKVITEIVNQVKQRNSDLADKNIEVQSGVIKAFLTDAMKTLIRSWFDRGLVGYKSGLENTTGLNFGTQTKERKVENETGIDKIMYPRMTQNIEKDTDTNTENIPDDKKPDTPEADNFKNACEEIDCITKPMKTIRSIPNNIREKLSMEEQQSFKKAFNEKFNQCTKLEYDDFLRGKTSIEYALYIVKQK